MKDNIQALRALLGGGLPLDRVGPHLRHAARRALRVGDPAKMEVVARIISSELLHRGDLLRVAVEGQDDPHKQFCLVRGTSDLVDLRPLGWDTMPLKLVTSEGQPAMVKPKAREVDRQPRANIHGFDKFLRAMEGAQHLKVGDPKSGETPVILASVLDFLEEFTPHFKLHVMLLKKALVVDDAVANDQLRVFYQDTKGGEPDWMELRQPGQSVFLPDARQLPRALARYRSDRDAFQVAVGVPLYAPEVLQENPGVPQEAGLLFLMATESWDRDAAIRHGVRLSRFITHRWQMHVEVNKKIQVDALTGLFNRGYYDGHLPLLVERARRNQSSLALVVADIDLFKSINTKYGLVAGDSVLKMVASRFQEELRRVDVICRRGGEEFSLILPDTDFDAARDVMTRLLAAKYEVEIENKKGGKEKLAVRFSYGVAMYPDNAKDAFQLDNQAQQMMFNSKDRGRDRCHFYMQGGNHLVLTPGQDST